jgi:hypothetical protein
MNPVAHSNLASEHGARRQLIDTSVLQNYTKLAAEVNRADSPNERLI